MPEKRNKSVQYEWDETLVPFKFTHQSAKLFLLLENFKEMLTWLGKRHIICPVEMSTNCFDSISVQRQFGI